MNELGGKVALVTGGGQGLGEAISRTLADAGCTVVIADIKQQSAQRVCADLVSQGKKADAVHLDVSDERSVSTTVQQVLGRHQRIDVLVNDAGTDKTAPIEELSVSDWDRVIGVNLTGPFLMTRQVMPQMKKQGGGQIVNIVSTAAKRAWANAAAYHASKWGLLGFTYAMHVEGRKENVKVTAVIAGGMRTPFLLDRFPDLDPNVLQDPKNVADTIRFLLTTPAESVIPEVMVLPMRETSWP